MITTSDINGSSASALSQITDSQDVDQEDFLTLLVAQLQNQDPLNPTENQEFVAELATFSSLEQQTQQTKLLEQMIQNQNSTNTSQALELIGKDVSAQQTRFNYQPGQELNFDFQTNRSENTVVQIVTDGGTVVDSEVLSTPAPGQYTYTFDGVRSDGSPLPAGVYNIVVGGTTSNNGESSSLPTFMRGTVEGVNFQDGKPVLVVNGQPIDMNQINAVFNHGGNS